MLRNVSTYGCRYAEEDEIIDVTTKIKCSDDSFKSGGVSILSNGEIAHIADKDMHSLTVGSTGSMKTRRVIMPTIATLIKSGESMVLNDVKGELYKRYLKPLEHHGYNIVVLNFRDTGRGSRWNPLSVAYEHYQNGEIDKSTECIRDIADCLYKSVATEEDPFWENSAKDLFCGIAFILRKEGTKDELTLENIRLTHSLGDEKIGSSRYLNEYCKDTDKFSDISVHVSGSINAPNDTRASIYSVFSQPLSMFLQENLRDMLCESDFDFSTLSTQKTAIFIISPDERSVYYPVISLFIKQCYGCLIDIAHEQEEDALPIRVNFIIDEFSSLPQISDFQNMISAARSRNIRFHLVVQNLSQLYKSYTKEIADTILTNCGVWLILRSKDNMLHELIGKMCGNYISEYSHEQRPLINPMTIQRLDKERGECLILMDGQYPFFTELPDIDSYSFNFPVTDKVTFSTRQPKPRKLWDIQEKVKQLKELQYLEIVAEKTNKGKEAIKQNQTNLNENLFPPPNPLQQSSPFDMNLFHTFSSKLEELDKTASKVIDFCEEKLNSDIPQTYDSANNNIASVIESDVNHIGQLITKGNSFESEAPLLTDNELAEMLSLMEKADSANAPKSSNENDES